MTNTVEFKIPLSTENFGSATNKGALDWKTNEVAAFGNGNEVRIIDTRDLKTLQVLCGHEGEVSHLLWLPSGRQFNGENRYSNRDLISADSRNHVIVWDVVKGQALFNFLHPDSSKQILDIKLAQGADNLSQYKVIILYSGNDVVLFDHANCSFQDVRIHQSNKNTGNDLALDNIIKFSIDPFHFNKSSISMVFLGVDAAFNSASVAFCDSWDYFNDLKINLNEKIGIPGLSLNQNQGIVKSSSSFSGSTSLHNISELSSNDAKINKPPTSALRKLMSDIIVGPGESSKNTFISFNDMNATIFHHPGFRETVIVMVNSTIVLISCRFRVILHTFTLEAGLSPFLSVIPLKSQPYMLTLHENGTLFIRKYSIQGTHSLSVQFETVAMSENSRLVTKKTIFLGCMLNPVHENSMLAYMSDGRLMKYDLIVESSKVVQLAAKKHATTPSTPYIQHAFWDQNRMAPAGTELPTKVSSFNALDENENNVIKIKLKRITNPSGEFTCLTSRDRQIVAGSSTGHVTVMRLLETRVKYERKFSLHAGFPVAGIQYLSDDLIISYANINLTGNTNCEMLVTDLKTGASKILKPSKDNHHILTISVSPLKRYFVLVYKNGSAPCELWDAERLRRIKTLPNKLPPITCVTWKEPTDSPSSDAKEIFYLTDYGTFLFTFTVDGNRFTNATCVKLDTTGNLNGIPVSVFSRGNLVYRADSTGTLVLYNKELKTASGGMNLGHTFLKSMHPYQKYFLAHFADYIELWDSSEVKKITSLHHGKLRAVHVTIVDNLVAYITKNQEGIKFLPLKITSTAIIKKPLIPAYEYPCFLDASEKCRKIVSLMKNEGSTIMDVRNLSLELCALDEFEFWNAVYVSQLKKHEENVEKIQESSLMGLLSNNENFKDLIMKTALCVWNADSSKRDYVGRQLIWIGEPDKAAEIFLDTEPSDTNNYVLNGLKASISVAANTLPESSKAVLKIVATNLIASGDMDRGLELLCVLGKQSEACSYLESLNQWKDVILMSKTSLPKSKARDCLAKYAHYLNSKKCVLLSASLYVHIGNFERATEVLFGSRLRHITYLLLYYCERHNIPINISDHIKLAIKLDFARFLFDNRLIREAVDFCDCLGMDGLNLKQELEILSC